ncbi:MAG: hypothetical protein JXA20_09175 [Spirochaetes bacterium]|nr:hypothetical protein [Spirochaetota bacterium]
MGVREQIDSMMAEVRRMKRKPEYVIMGRGICMRWLVEEATSGSRLSLQKRGRYSFSYRGVPVVVCESEILEVVPNARYLLGDAG